ncbi:uncharacterized protein [Bemisia tabaci]
MMLHQPKSDVNPYYSDESTLLWPYRTSPLVLPGAKVKKDKPYTESYLRHHPNPAMRAAPGHYDPSQEVLMKQRVADTIIHRVGHDDGKNIVNKQYNTPIGLYSEKNIADSIQSQTGQGFGPTPYKKTYVYNPAKSETYKALQESEHEKFHEPAQPPVQPPVQTRVFSPVQSKRLTAPTAPDPNRASPQPHPTAPHPNANYTGVNSEEIHQSGSFKRLMHMVMTESY